MSGWICSYRKIWDHPLFRGNALRVGAWHWMMHMAAISETRFMADGQVIALDRGQFCASQQQMCDATGMTRKQLRAFLDALEGESAVVQKRANDRAKGRTIVTICNYDQYQNFPASEGPSKGQAGAKEGPTKEQVNTSSPIGEGAEDAAANDPVKVMFDGGCRLLGTAGMTPRQARSLLGKWRKDHGPEAVIAALGRAQREGAIDPVAFIEGCLKSAFSKAKETAYGETRINRNGERVRYVGGQVGWERVYA